MRIYDTVRGEVPYADLSVSLWGGDGREGTDEEVFFRANPHRIDLGRIGLVLPDGVGVGDLAEIDQRLNLSNGQLSSRFLAGGVPYQVLTVVDMATDAVGVVVRGGAQSVGVRLSFAYGSQHPGNAQDWTRPEAHSTALRGGPGCWVVDRVMDDTRYQVEILTDADVRMVGPHEIVISGTVGVGHAAVGAGLGHAARSGSIHDRGGYGFCDYAQNDGGSGLELGVRLEAVIRFVPVSDARWALAGELTEQPSDLAVVLERTAAAWRAYWDGGAVELAGSDHRQALELERRIVLSRYLTRINSAGLLPVAETGLYVNSWRGKFHLEMQWWHLAHFALWGQATLVERVLGWYDATLEAARQLARSQGCPGARWLKSSGPEARQTPSSIGAFLIWQQPHPIYLAELVRRASGTEAVQRWWPVVRATAEFMAAYPVTVGEALVFPPPLIPSQESYSDLKDRITQPTYELAYWVWGLRAAADWAEAVRANDLAESWRSVASRMKRPKPRHGLYPSINIAPWTIRTDHPSVVAALGVTPDVGVIDPGIMAATLADVRRQWDWASTWGWDYPMMAMTAARVGRPDWAVEALLLDTGKNTYLPNGHNWQTADLPAYLPGNGGLLAAVALMCAGSDSGPARPGFPPGWKVEHDGILPLP